MRISPWLDYQSVHYPLLHLLLPRSEGRIHFSHSRYGRCYLKPHGFLLARWDKKTLMAWANHMDTIERLVALGFLEEPQKAQRSQEIPRAWKMFVISSLKLLCHITRTQMIVKCRCSWCDIPFSKNEPKMFNHRPIIIIHHDNSIIDEEITGIAFNNSSESSLTNNNRAIPLSSIVFRGHPHYNHSWYSISSSITGPSNIMYGHFILVVSTYYIYIYIP